MTRDIPILFSAPTVRPIMAGTKTQTRRTLKPQPDAGPGGQMVDLGGGEYGLLDGDLSGSWKLRWQPGDRLWVREQWSGHHLFRDTKPAERRSFVVDGWPYLREDVWYWADGNPTASDYERPRSPLHMPRWASRITLLVTDVRVQRLQDISEADARAEGAPPWTGAHQSYVTGFYNIWATINGRGSWDANPWVATLSFERVT